MKTEIIISIALISIFLICLIFFLVKKGSPVLKEKLQDYSKKDITYFITFGIIGVVLFIGMAIFITIPTLLKAYDSSADQYIGYGVINNSTSWTNKLITLGINLAVPIFIAYSLKEAWEDSLNRLPLILTAILPIGALIVNNYYSHMIRSNSIFYDTYSLIIFGSTLATIIIMWTIVGQMKK